ncbi:MAG: sulfotransferase, partial [Rudaea sp.]
WYGLAEIKTLKLRSDELVALKEFCESPTISIPDRSGLMHALGKGLEDANDHAGAFSAFGEAGQGRRQMSPWDASAFREKMALARAAFPNPLDLECKSRGSEVIFIVGLPRSGSTLTEQILAAHPEVEGASELPDLNAVLQEESNRRRAPLGQWLKEANESDWKRLGETYLVRTARWREKRPRFTDKLPENWELAEAALAMLPGSHWIDCRRDPVETCWSCFKQLFAPGRVIWSYSFDELAIYWQECRRHMDYLSRRYPGSVRTQYYEALLEDAEGQTRELLGFCGLEFSPACLRFYDAARAVRTASAAQVREPIRRDTARTEHYGELLDSLRALLRDASAELDAPN